MKKIAEVLVRTCGVMAAEPLIGLPGHWRGDARDQQASEGGGLHVASRRIPSTSTGQLLMLLVLVGMAGWLGSPAIASPQSSSRVQAPDGHNALAQALRSDDPSVAQVHRSQTPLINASIEENLAIVQENIALGYTVLPVVGILDVTAITEAQTPGFLIAYTGDRGALVTRTASGRAIEIQSSDLSAALKAILDAKATSGQGGPQDAIIFAVRPDQLTEARARINAAFNFLEPEQPAEARVNLMLLGRALTDRNPADDLIGYMTDVMNATTAQWWELEAVRAAGHEPTYKDAGEAP